MKKLEMFVVAVVCVFCFAVPAFADNNSAVVDSLRAAQVFGGMKIASYEGQFSFQRNGAGDYVSADFKMALNGTITYLKVGDVVVVNNGDQPLVGLPVNAIGETRSFYFWLSALDTDGNQVAYGNFQKELLLPGDPIVVILNPANWTMQFVSFSGVDAVNAILKTDSGSTFDYSVQANGFTVWVDPLKSTTAYTIVDTVTGLTIASGNINPMACDQTPTISFVNVLKAGGVVTVPDGTYTRMEDQTIDGKTGDTPVKVYIWNLNGIAGNVGTWSPDGYPQVRILRWMPTGTMPEIGTSDEYGNVSIGSGYDKVIVVVIGTARQKFQINFSSDAPTSNYGGGGKG